MKTSAAETKKLYSEKSGIWQSFIRCFTDKSFMKRMLKTAWPICLYMLLENGVTLADTMMITRLGETAVAAVGLANQMSFLVFLIFFGITSGTSIFIAQFWGDKDTEGIHHVQGLSLLVIICFGAPFALAALFIPELLMRIFTPDPAVIQMGIPYLRIIAPSYIINGIAFNFGTALRSVEKPMYSLVATGISMALNVLLNLVLIFGLLGFPAMGVRGAALATAISRTAELFIILFFIFHKKLPVAASLKEYAGFSRSLVVKFTKTAGPVLLNEIVWSLGMVAYKMVFARMGTVVIATVNITEAILAMFSVVLMGSCTTSAIMIGKKIGEKDKEGAEEYAHFFMIQSLITGLIMGVLTAAAAPAVVHFLKMEPQTVQLTRITLLYLAFLTPIKSFNMHIIVGILRSGGDTNFAFISEFTGVWAVGVPMAVLGGLFLHQPLYIVYLMIAGEEVLKFVLAIIRIKSRKWINDLTRTHQNPPEITHETHFSEINPL